MSLGGSVVVSGRACVDGATDSVGATVSACADPRVVVSLWWVRRAESCGCWCRVCGVHQKWGTALDARLHFVCLCEVLCFGLCVILTGSKKWVCWD